MAHPSLWAVLLVAMVGIGSVSAATWAMKKCAPNARCEQAEFPYLDWDPETKNCVCRAHPCHHDSTNAAEGMTTVHSCEEPNHLHFWYTAEKTLQCGCRPFPQVASEYISKDLCAGYVCEDEEFPLLDYDESKPEKERCLCRRHPCKPDENNLQHECNTPENPVLTFFYGEGGKTECRCQRAHKAAKPGDQAAGAGEAADSDDL